MSLTEFSIKNRTLTYFIVFLLVAGGLASFINLGQLEDPEFSIKTALVVTPYPGASPEEVELEVTDRIELALQEIPSLDYVESWSWAGYSMVKAEIKAEFWSDRLPQEWDTLRKKIREIETSLPPGAGRPIINDDFGDVFGLVMAITGDGFSYADMEKAAKDLKKELSIVEGVARVDLWGVQDQVIYFDVAETQLAELGLTDESIVSTLQQQNMVVDAGQLDVREKRFRIAPTGEFQSPADIADLAIRPSLRDTITNLTGASPDLRTEELIRIRDLGTIRRGYLEPPAAMMRFNGAPAIGLSITNVAGANIVEMGRAVDRRLAEVMEKMPVGIEMHKVHWMSDVVDQSVKGFFINLMQAVAIVLVVLAVSMGWRMGLIIGTALLFTILATFILMALYGVDLQRMSLGALVIALGMMVDNAIVVADGFVVRLQKGMDRTKAAIESATTPAMPLLGATIIAVMAFYPIFASVEGAGEYCRTLFTVVAMSLLSSWIISVTVTPLQCIDMIPDPKEGNESPDPYKGTFFRKYLGFLQKAIRFRVIFMGGMVALLVVSVIGFGWVKQLFFPDSSMNKFMIDYWAVQGTRIQQVGSDLEALEEKLIADDRVESVSAFIGQGPPRFYLPVDPESPNPSYGQLIVNVHDFRDIDGLIDDLNPWLEEKYPDALVPLRKYGVGPSNTWRFEVRISGPAVADPAVLRELAEEGVNILRDEPLTGAIQTDWRQQVQKVVPVYNQARARWAAITRQDIADTTKRAFDGRAIGLYREEDDLIPIVLRHVEEERKNVSAIDTLQVQPIMSTNTIPMSQVTDGVQTEWEDPVIGRRDRRRTITVQANPIAGVTLPTLRAAVVDKFEAIQLPPGYILEWGGEYEDTVDSQASLVPGIVPAVAIILLIIVALFNAFRPLFIILLTIPFAIIGITTGLLTFNTPFGFLALLGAMSLAGMMIKNAIVLLDEVNINLGLGKTPYDAVIDASMSRLRPVVLAAATTVLGVVPLLQDVFWIGMAVTIMAGLTFGTILTMMVVPVLYTVFFRIPSPEGKKIDE
jgi:multidrug efflux pump subunit AcrB